MCSSHSFGLVPSVVFIVIVVAPPVNKVSAGSGMPERAPPMEIVPSANSPAVSVFCFISKNYC